MIKFIMIIIVIGQYNQPTGATSIEFESLEQCNVAASEIRDLDSNGRILAHCITRTVTKQ